MAQLSEGQTVLIHLAELAGLVDQDVVTPYVSARLALSEAAEAHRMIEGRHARGKIVLEMV